MKNVHTFIYLSVVQIALVFAMHLLRKRVPVSLTREQQNTFQGPFSFVVTVYAFLLGFVVVNLWQTMAQAERTASKEAETVAVVYRLLAAYPGGQDVRIAVEQYAASVVREEWPAMEKGETSPATEGLAARVFQEFRKISPSTSKEQAIYPEILGQLNNVFQLRRDRLLTSAGTGSMPDVMWIALGYGGVMVLAGLYFQSVGNQKEQVVIDFTVIWVLFVTVYLIVQFNSPFQGQVRVSPKAFERIVAAVVPSPKQEYGASSGKEGEP